MEIYLDNNATTPIDPRVQHAMQEAPMGNPSSFHAWGRKAREALKKSRECIAAHLSVLPSEFVFTSGGTESLNTLIRGIPSTKIITTSIEHAAVQETIQALSKPKTILPVTHSGTIDPKDLETAEGDLIVLSAVNSETGAMLDIEKVAAIADSRSIPLILDGVALLGKELFTLPRGVTAMAFSAHKLHGPTGVGGYFLRSGTKCSPLLFGGGQERGGRSGTENVPGAVGFATAVSLIEDPETLRHLRDTFELHLGAEINASGKRVSNTSNLYFPGISGETVLISLDMHGVMASQGSACAAGAIQPSRVLLAMGYDAHRAKNSLRFSFSRMNTIEEVKAAATLIESISQSASLGKAPLPTS